MGSHLPKVTQQVSGRLRSALRPESRVHACCAPGLSHPNLPWGQPSSGQMGCVSLSRVTQDPSPLTRAPLAAQVSSQTSLHWPREEPPSKSPLW